MSSIFYIRRRAWKLLHSRNHHYYCHLGILHDHDQETLLSTRRFCFKAMTLFIVYLKMLRYKQGLIFLFLHPQGRYRFCMYNQYIFKTHTIAAASQIQKHPRRFPNNLFYAEFVGVNPLCRLGKTYFSYTFFFFKKKSFQN